MGSSKAKAALRRGSFDAKRLAKAALAKMVMGLFFISAVMILFVLHLINVQMQNYENTVTKMTQTHLRSTVQSLKDYLTVDELDMFHMSEDTYRPEYLRLKIKLAAFAEEHDVHFAYFWRDYGDGRMQYIADNDHDPSTQVGPHSFETIKEAAAFDALAGRVSVTDSGDYKEGWEGLTTAYAPVFNRDGSVCCVAGVDIKSMHATAEEKARLATVVQELARLVAVDELNKYHTIDDVLNYDYLRIRKRLITFADEHSVKFAYYWREADGDRKQYIVDNDTNPETWVGPHTFEPIDEHIAHKALAGKVGVSDLGEYAAHWEGLITAYAPVLDSAGNVYAVAGVDISDEFIFTQRQDAQRMKLLQLIAIPLAVLLAVVNMLLYRRKTIQIQRAHVKLQYFNNNLRRAFSTYLSEDVVEEIVSDPTRLQLGGIQRHMTVLFTDIKGFTHIAENLTPEQLVDLLNYYLSTMSDVILEQKGTIDKYQGDAIVSFFGAPIELNDHALRACVSSIIMKRLEGEVNEYVSKHKLSPTPLYTRIGINTGSMVVGNMGTQKKMNYTIIANAVNLASRLEGVNKQYGTWILASDMTVKETGGKLVTRRLDKIRVVGINEPVRIHEVIETRSHASSELREMVNSFDKALTIFEERKWRDALAAFNAIHQKFPNDQPTLLYIKRCEEYLTTPPADDWDGVFVISEK